MRIIVNVDRNYGIGSKGQLQVYLSEDLKRFKQLTSGGIVVYGRKTLDTFPKQKPLPNRQNIVLSRSNDLQISGATVVADISELFLWIKANVKPDEQQTVWVIGGASVYRQLLPYCDQVWLTEHTADLEADVYFPRLAEQPNWLKISETEYFCSEKEVEYRYSVWQNLRPQEM